MFLDILVVCLDYTSRFAYRHTYIHAYMNL